MCVKRCLCRGYISSLRIMWPKFIFNHTRLTRLCNLFWMLLARALIVLFCNYAPAIYSSESLNNLRLLATRDGLLVISQDWPSFCESFLYGVILSSFASLKTRVFRYVHIKKEECILSETKLLNRQAYIFKALTYCLLPRSTSLNTFLHSTFF